MGVLQNKVGTEAAVRALSTMRTKYHQHNNAIWKVVYIVQVVVVLSLVADLVKVLYGGGENWEDFHNSYCMNNAAPSYINSTTLNGTVDAACAYDYNFKKVVYFWCDGISWDTAGPIFDNFPTNNNIFKIRHSDNPWSAWVYAAFITGKPNRNMGEIENDNLMYQFWQAGLKAYLGARDSTAYVMGQIDMSFSKDRNISYYTPTFYDDSTRMFQWLFDCTQFNTPGNCSNYVLNRAKANDRSIFFESFILDHRAHETNSKYSAAVNQLRDRLAQDIASVKKWVDANPEYLLVMVSDHGQKISTAQPDIHGPWLADGNEGWMMLYNPSLHTTISSPTNPIVLHTVDVAPTLWQFFSASGVSIPAESVGKVYPVTTSAQIKYKALLVNAIQLRKYLDEEDTFTDDKESKWRSAQSNFENGLYEQAVADMDAYVSYLSKKFVEESGAIPFKVPLFSSVIFLVTSVILQFGSRAALWAAARRTGYGIIASPYLAWLIIALFFTQSSDLAARHQVYTYAIPLCAYIASYTYKRMSKASPTEKNGHHRLVSIELKSTLTSHTDDDDEYGLADDFRPGKPIHARDGDQDAALEEGDALKSTETSMLPVTDQKQFMYFRVWDHLKQRNFREAALSFFNYIIGAQKMPHSSVSFWLLISVVVFAIFSCFEIAFIHKRFIWDDISALYKFPSFLKLMSFSVLLVEFRWQRILLTSNLQLDSGKWLSRLPQVLHPAFWPLNIKMVGYFILISIARDPTDSQAFMVYYTTFAHIGLLLLSPAYLQRDLFLPLFTLSFMVSTPQEQILLCMYSIVLLFFSNTLEKPSPCNRHALPMILVAMICLSHYYFAVLYSQEYVLDRLDLVVPGIPDVTKSPDFSVLIMGVHYTSVFCMLVPFIIRLVVPAPPPLRPFKLGYFMFGHVPISQPPSASSPPSTQTKRFVMTFLMFCSSLSVIFYLLSSISQRTDNPLIWAFMNCAVSAAYGITVVCHEILGALMSLLRFLKRTVSKFS